MTSREVCTLLLRASSIIHSVSGNTRIFSILKNEDSEFLSTSTTVGTDMLLKNGRDRVCMYSGEIQVLAYVLSLETSELNWLLENSQMRDFPDHSFVSIESFGIVRYLSGQWDSNKVTNNEYFFFVL